MRANGSRMALSRGRRRRRGAAAVEFALCLPLMMMLLTGLWEIGRIIQVQIVMTNSARESARDASLAQANLLTVANSAQVYLQGAAPTAFGSGHTTSMIAPVVTLPANTTGYTCWDSTSNRELFTITFTDLTNTTVTDPTLMSQLDLFQIGIQAPYNSISWSSIIPIPGATRINATVTWASLQDSPFQIAPSLPAQ